MIGDIWRTSWGYDQTNAEFFEVVRETAASLVVRRIGAQVRDGRLYPMPGNFCTDGHLMGNPGTPNWDRDRARGYSEKLCRKPQVDKGGYVHRSIRIDNVRLAWPYEGSGVYDTYAAGGMGH